MTPRHLPGFLHSLAPLLTQHGYLAVGGLVLLEDFGVPVPGETILILGAVYAGAGRLNVFVVGLMAFLAAVAGDNLGFAIGRFGGRPVTQRFGRYVLLSPERLDRASAFVERHGAKVVVVARFVEGLRQANGIIAGISEMHWLRFLAFNALGAGLWVAVWTTLGYLSGSHLDVIYHDIKRYEIYAAIAAAVLIAAYVTRRLLRRRGAH